MSNYELCGGHKRAEKELGRLWENKCPVPAMTAQQSISAKLSRAVKIFIGEAPVTMSVRLEVEDGGSTVGCQSFEVQIEA
ncbi:uncharacterized protein LOC144142489 isoform X2 [Haemaphysalis longicornis]